MRRNHIFHSIMTFGPSDRFETAEFHKREANNGLKVKTHSLEAEEMREVSHAFIDEVSKLMDQCIW
jgi:hypothetical protein